MARIELSQLIAEMTPEQKIFVQWFYSQFDNGSAANRRILNIEPFFYQGIQAGSELLVYAANKLYICFEFDAKEISGTGLAGAALISFYDAANAAFYYYNHTFAYYDTAIPAVRYIPTDWINKNFYFSRLALLNYDYLRFVGYRVTLV